MEEVKPKEYDITVTIKWDCPKCNHENKETYDPGPYRSIADDPIVLYSPHPVPAKIRV